MLENSISIESKDIKNHINIDVHNLRDTEQGILNYMLLSSTNFLEIKDKLIEDDFTFLIHKLIFKHLVILEEMFLADDFKGVKDLNTKLEIFADILNERENVKIASTLDILSQAPSMYIKSDLEIINANSMEKEIAMISGNIANSVTIDTKDGTTWLNFMDGRLISVGTTNIAKLPAEVYDNFDAMLNSLSTLDLQNGENEASMIFYGDPENPDGIESFYLKKDVAELKWFDDICQWADKYDLDEDIFPRNREKLKDLFKLDISNKGIAELPKDIGKLSNLRILFLDNNNIKELPDEIYQLKSLIFLSFLENEISFISPDINDLEGLLMFGACHNNITQLPMSFYSLTKLKTLCLHGNKITMLPNELGNLSSLTSLTISNNDMKELPQSISRLEKLESLDIENTQIKDIPIELIKHKNLNALSMNDDLLPFIAKNIEYLDVDTINLSASYFQESSSIIQELNLEINTEKWIEDRDKKDNGCVKFLTYEKEESIE